MDAQKMLPKLKEVSTKLFSRPSSLYSEGAFTLDGASIVTTSCLLTAFISLATIYAIPEMWLSFLLSFLLALCTIWAVTRPSSCGFTAIYYLNLFSFALTLLSNVFTLLLVIFVSDEEIIRGVTMKPESGVSVEFIQSVLPMGRIVLLGLVSLTTFNAYVTVAALKAVRRGARAEPLLPQ